VFLIHGTESFQHTLNNRFPLGTDCNWRLAAMNLSGASSPRLAGLPPPVLGDTVRKRHFLPLASAHLAVLTMRRGLIPAGNFACNVLG